MKMHLSFGSIIKAVSNQWNGQWTGRWNGLWTGRWNETCMQWNSTKSSVELLSYSELLMCIESQSGSVCPAGSYQPPTVYHGLITASSLRCWQVLHLV